MHMVLCCKAEIQKVREEMKEAMKHPINEREEANERNE